MISLWLSTNRLQVAHCHTGYDSFTRAQVFHSIVTFRGCDDLQVVETFVRAFALRTLERSQNALSNARMLS